MITSFEFDKMFSIHLPDGAWEEIGRKLAEMGLDGEEITDQVSNLFEEVFHYYVTTPAVKQNWVYLYNTDREQELFSTGWYNVDNLPDSWEGTELQHFRNWIKHPSNRMVWLLIEGLEVRVVGTTWEKVTQ